jgi:hypothetical protein
MIKTLMKVIRKGITQGVTHKLQLPEVFLCDPIPPVMVGSGVITGE